MEKTKVDEITLLFDSDGKQFVDLFAEACAKSIPIIHDMWGLNVPPHCKVYIMTSWQKFMFHSASWPAKIFYALTIPLWYIQTNKEWSKIGGWTLTFQSTVGVKPPSLDDSTDKTIGERIFIRDPNKERKVQTNLCHELVHAFSGYLKLPTWLNEGIAMYTVDKYLGIVTVKDETIKYLETYPYKHRMSNSRDLMNKDDDCVVYNYVRGYWLTRYLEQNYPGFIKGMLDKCLTRSEIEIQMSNRIGICPSEFWNEIDKELAFQFTLDNTGK